MALQVFFLFSHNSQETRIQGNLGFCTSYLTWWRCSSRFLRKIWIIVVRYSRFVECSSRIQETQRSSQDFPKQPKKVFNISKFPAIVSRSSRTKFLVFKNFKIDICTIKNFKKIQNLIQEFQEQGMYSHTQVMTNKSCDRNPNLFRGFLHNKTRPEFFVFVTETWN